MAILFLIIPLIVLVFSAILHEIAHGYIADLLGDPTARISGRLTLNPLAHLDPLGTIALLIFHFGWGKPVEFDPYNLRNPRQDSAIISLAGPASNLILAVLLSLALRFLPLPYTLIAITQTLITINVILAIFNLVPVYPLDGEKILTGILPKNLAYEYASVMRSYGTIILILMIFPIFGGTSPISSLITPAVSFVTSLLL